MAEPINLPLQYAGIRLEVFRAPVAPLPNEQLMRLALSLSSRYTQTNTLPNGIQLSNPQLRRVLVYDLSKLLISEDLVTNVNETISQINATLQSVSEVLPLTPPFPCNALFNATIASLGQNAAEVLMQKLGSMSTELMALCDQYIGAGIRFVYVKGLYTIDLHLEPLFQDIRKFYVSMLFQRTTTPLQTSDELDRFLTDCLAQADQIIMPAVYRILESAD